VVSVDNASNDNEATSPGIDTQNQINPQDAAHGHAATMASTIPGLSLIYPVDALHGHTAEQPTVVPGWQIVVASTLQIHTATSTTVIRLRVPTVLNPANPQSTSTRPPALATSSREIQVPNSERVRYTGASRPLANISNRRR
jgi:hypothetical protein